jgi:hypothetical protein
MRRPCTGFTVVELMTSIAIGAMLCLGVNTVFRITGDSVGAGAAYADATRANMAAQPVVFDDLQAAAVLPPAAPFLIIRSETIPAFRNAADERSDRDYNPAITSQAEATLRVRTVDLDVNGVEGETTVPGEMVPRTALHPRNHRIDQLVFFARGSFPRQTGNDGTYAANMRCDEAMVWYGHLKQPNAAGDLADARNPGLQSLNWSRGQAPETRSTNPNNFYATDWILGRMPILLREPVGGMNGVIYDNHGVPQVYLQRGTSAVRTTLSPLTQQSHASASSLRDLAVGGADEYQIQWSRYDLAGTSIDGFRRILYDAIAAGRADWYEGAAGLGYRFAGYPYPTRPLSSAGYARTVPVFLPHCTQFVVEFAGDFVRQAPNGDVAPVARDALGFAIPDPDGVVDFVVRPDGGRAIRWYGYPRDLNGDGVIPGNRAKNNDMPDVIPVRDVAHAPFRFERNLNQTSNSDLPVKSNYATAAGVALDAKYLCAWGPDTVDCPPPRMLRLTLTLDDPRGRLPADGRTFEYTLNLP